MPERAERKRATGSRQDPRGSLERGNGLAWAHQRSVEALDKAITVRIDKDTEYKRKGVKWKVTARMQERKSWWHQRELENWVEEGLKVLTIFMWGGGGMGKWRARHETAKRSWQARTRIPALYTWVECSIDRVHENRMIHSTWRQELHKISTKSVHHWGGGGRILRKRRIHLEREARRRWAGFGKDQTTGVKVVHEWAQLHDRKTENTVKQPKSTCYQRIQSW